MRTAFPICEHDQQNRTVDFDKCYAMNHPQRPWGGQTTPTPRLVGGMPEITTILQFVSLAS